MRMRRNKVIKRFKDFDLESYHVKTPETLVVGMTTRVELIDDLYREALSLLYRKAKALDKTLYWEEAEALLSFFPDNVVEEICKYLFDDGYSGLDVSSLSESWVDDMLEDIREIILREARKKGRYRKAKELGVARPDLAKYYNIDPRAFLEVDKLMNKKGLDPKESYDSFGLWGLCPDNITRAWFGNGARPGGKFTLWVNSATSHFKKYGRADEFCPPFPRREESTSVYMCRLRVAETAHDWGIDLNLFPRNGDLRPKEIIRLGHMTKPSIYYALTNCLDEERNEIMWEKLSQWLRLDKREKAKFLPFKLAWSMLFKRKTPEGLGNKDPNPGYLDRVGVKSFRKLMKIVREESADESSLAANTKAAYHLSIVFRDIGTIERWIKLLSRQNTTNITAVTIHDAFVDGNKFVNLDFKKEWINFLLKFPEARKLIGYFKGFEEEYKRSARKIAELEEFATLREYGNIRLPEVAKIAAELDLDEEEFRDYEKFFLKNRKKSYTMLPHVVVKLEDYTFRKLDDHDVRGPFLGLYTDCCQHLHNAGSSCAKAGWRDPESGFYIIEKGGEIIAQSWAWRGRDGELCFDSIEGLGGVNVEKIAALYKEAARQLLGKLGITRVTVGDTEYGLTPEVRKILDGRPCTPAKMIKKVKYTDAEEQWLLAPND